jgi:FeS assembly SUF system protein
VAYLEGGIERRRPRSCIDGGKAVSSPELRDALRDRVILALRTVYDPEMPVNIYELGLVYDVRVDEAGQVGIRMTLTAPNCPVAGTLPAEVERKAASVPGVAGVKLELVFDPPWNKDMMSEAAKLALGIEDVIPVTRILR